MDYSELDVDRLSSEALGTSLNRRNAILEMLLKKGYIVFRGTYFNPLKTDSEFGAAFVLKENNLIRTAFSSKEYESDDKEMMEVYRQYAKSKYVKWNTWIRKVSII